MAEAANARQSVKWNFFFVKHSGGGGGGGSWVSNNEYTDNFLRLVDFHLHWPGMPVQHVQLLQVFVVLLPTLMQNHSDRGRVSPCIGSLSPRAPQDFDFCHVQRERGVS